MRDGRPEPSPTIIRPSIRPGAGGGRVGNGTGDCADHVRGERGSKTQCAVGPGPGRHGLSGLGCPGPADGWMTPDACLLSRVPPSWPRPRFLPFPPCGSGSRPLSDRRSLQRGSTNWLAGYCWPMPQCHPVVQHSNVLYSRTGSIRIVFFAEKRAYCTLLCCLLSLQPPLSCPEQRGSVPGIYRVPC